ncbi:MAG: menaquinone biosynthesis protein [Cyanobacteria bacterium REEB65]|nr:menaquinone biosynthesis protein [Cyanobacteria bacterium REEB65]
MIIAALPPMILVCTMVKLGEPHYISTLPLYYSLRSLRQPGCSLHTGGITELTEMLQDGSLDAGPITLVDYLRNSDRYQVLPGLSLSSLGRSHCVSLFSVRPAYELHGARIAAPPKASGAVALLRWLMQECYRSEPRFVPRTGDLAESIAGNDGVLLFQDAALRANARTADLFHVWDLGEAWWQITNTPLIYLLWVARREVPEQTVDQIVALFEAAKAHLPNVRDDALRQAERQTALPHPLLDGYFNRFQYAFTSAHQQSLERYRQTVAAQVLPTL